MDSHEPTNRLRFVERSVPAPQYGPNVVTTVRVLQQWWELNVYGLDGEKWTEGQWRDVSLERE